MHPRPFQQPFPAGRRRGCSGTRRCPGRSGRPGRPDCAVPYLFVPVIWTMPWSEPAPFDSVRLTVISPSVEHRYGAMTKCPSPGTRSRITGGGIVLDAVSAKPRIDGQSPRAHFDGLVFGYRSRRVLDDRAVFAELTSARSPGMHNWRRGWEPARRQTRRHRNRCCPAVPRRSNRSCRPGWHPGDFSLLGRRCRCWARCLPVRIVQAWRSLLGSINSPLSHCQPPAGSRSSLAAWKPPIHDSLPRRLRLNQAMDEFVLRKRVDRCKLPENPVIFQRLGGRLGLIPGDAAARRPPGRSGRRTRPSSRCDSAGSGRKPPALNSPAAKTRRALLPPGSNSHA